MCHCAVFCAKPSSVGLADWSSVATLRRCRTGVKATAVLYVASVLT